MKKILFFIESLAGGGAEKVLTTIVKKLDKSKFDVTVCAVVKTGVFVKEVEKHCKLVVMLPQYDTVSGLIQKAKYRLDYKFIYSSDPRKVYQTYIHDSYDVEIAFVEGFATKLIAASPNRESKKLCWVHIDMESNPYADQFFSSVEEEREIYQTYDAIVGVSKSVQKTFEQKFNLYGKMQVIYNPVDSEDILHKSQGSHSVKRNKGLQIVSVGRLEPQKGYDRLIRALGKVKSQGTAFHLWLLGEGSMRGQLEALIRENFLEEEVSLLGFQENPYPWIAASDVFVCTSRAEGYSLVIAEAMILGKPVISVDCAGPNELLHYGEYGVLIPNSDAAIEKTLSALVAGTIDLRHYAALSLARREFFELACVMRQIETLLEGESQGMNREPSAGVL